MKNELSVFMMLMLSATASYAQAPTRVVDVPPGQDEVVIPYKPGTTPKCGVGLDCRTETLGVSKVSFVPSSGSNSNIRLRLGPIMQMGYYTPKTFEIEWGLMLELSGPHFYVYGAGAAGYSGLTALHVSLAAGYEFPWGLRLGGKIIGNFYEDFYARGGESLQARLVGGQAEVAWSAKKFFVVALDIGAGQEGHVTPGGRVYQPAFVTSLMVAVPFDLLGNGSK